MLWGKLLSGLRVSSVLTSFLLWPVLLACVMPLPFWSQSADDGRLPADRRAVLRDDGDDGPVLLDDVSQVGDEPDLHVLDHRGDVHRPGGGEVLCRDVFSRHAQAAVVEKLGVLSPFSATFALPLNIRRAPMRAAARRTRASMPTCGCSSATSAGRFCTTALLLWR